jgi:hypothetical protein
MLSIYRVDFMMFLTAFPFFVGAFAVTQIESETKTSPSTSLRRRGGERAREARQRRGKL